MIPSKEYHPNELDFFLLQFMRIEAQQQDNGKYQLYVNGCRVPHPMYTQLTKMTLVNGAYILGNRAYLPNDGVMKLYTVMNRADGDLIWSLRSHINHKPYTEIFAISDDVVLTNILPERLEGLITAYRRGVANGNRKEIKIETAPYR